MGLLSKPKVPSLDTGALKNIANQTAQTQRDLITQRMAGLEPLNAQFKTGREGLSARIPQESEALLTQLVQDTGKIGEQEQAQNAQATQAFREQSFRDVPEIQKMIRNQLAGSRLMGSGAALSSLAKPTINAAQSSADMASQLEQQRLGNAVRRSEDLASTGFTTRQKAMADRLGLDDDTLNQLTQMGRGDLIQKFSDLSGVEGQYGADMMNIEQARQANEMAKAAANRSAFGSTLSTLGNLGGMGVGALFGGPMGAAIGGQLGGTLGGMVGGQQTQQFDPTLMFALAQRNKAAVQGGLANTAMGRNTPTAPANYYVGRT
jgi:hypothetical protein